MIRGAYSSAAGMESSKLMNEALADNLANANTNGYKSYKLIHKIKAEQAIFNPEGQELGKVTNGAQAFDTRFNFAQGALRETGNPLDLAYNGKGFFAVQDNQGRTFYTRNGHFNINQEGFLVNQHGNLVLDANFSTIFMGVNGISSVNFLLNGNVIVNGNYVTTMKAFDFPEGTAIVRSETDKFQPANESAVMAVVDETTLQQGFVETSNVSPVKSAADMVQVMRGYETNQHALKAQMETVDMLLRISDSI